MEEKAYHYAQMEPKQLDKLRQAEKNLGQLTEREIVLVAYEKEQPRR